MRHSRVELKSGDAGGNGLLKVLTLNLHKGFSLFGRRFVLHELREAVRSISADIVFLQEVLGEHGTLADRHANWPVVAQYEFLADKLWPNFAYGRNAIYPEGHHGNALLSKFPIVEYQNRDVSEADAENRGLLHAVIDVPGWPLPLHAICVHLGLTEQHRRNQVRKLVQVMTDEVPADASAVVAGDFNDWRNRASRVLAADAELHDVFAGGGGKPARTFPARWPLFRLDRIYVKHLVVGESRVLSKRPWSHLSDHAALACELERR